MSEPKVIKHKKVTVGKYTYEITKIRNVAGNVFYLIKRNDAKRFGQMIWSISEVRRKYPNLRDHLKGF